MGTAVSPGRSSGSVSHGCRSAPISIFMINQRMETELFDFTKKNNLVHSTLHRRRLIYHIKYQKTLPDVWEKVKYNKAHSCKFVAIYQLVLLLTSEALVLASSPELASCCSRGCSRRFPPTGRGEVLLKICRWRCAIPSDIRSLCTDPRRAGTSLGIQLKALSPLPLPPDEVPLIDVVDIPRCPQLPAFLRLITRGCARLLHYLSRHQASRAQILPTHHVRHHPRIRPSLVRAQRRASLSLRNSVSL